jgi:hypothetical protein
VIGYAVKKPIISRAIPGASFSVGMCPAFGIRTSLVFGISAAKRSANSIFWKPSSSPQIRSLGFRGSL